MKRMSMKRILTLSTLVAAAAMFSIGCSALLDNPTANAHDYV